jgi:uncharacterized protein with gpF-like domain
MADIVPKEALAYIKNKKLHPAFSYRDVWNEEHATMFTVAKAMQIDVLSDIKKAVETAIEKGLPFEQFRKEIEPTLREKGWWGKKNMIDPVTEKPVKAQLGNDRRLKTIYDTNLRSAYQEGRWERTQKSTAHPYLMYRVGPSKNHRQDHLSWDGLVLPKDDPWWNSHYPPNGWGCKCWTMAVSEERKERLEQSGVTVPPSVDGDPGYTVPVKTEAPPTRYKTWVDERTGRIEKIPEGISPGFNWNVGQRKRSVPNLESLVRKAQKETPEQYDGIMKSLMTNTVYKTEYHDAVRNALERGKARRSDDRNAIPAGFLDQKILKALRKEGKNKEKSRLLL